MTRYRKISPAHRPAWADERGGYLASLETWAERWAARVKEAIQMAQRIPGGSVKDVVADVLTQALFEAYHAGIREGESRERARASKRLEQRLRLAVENLTEEPAPCPHCSGGRTEYGACKPCKGTGNRLEKSRDSGD